MGIRSTAKAIIIKDNKILLNKCSDINNGDYYSLPGGGQKKYESLCDAVVRECLEETGYLVKVVRFASFCEVICTNTEFRERYPEYAHKMFHIFVCQPQDQDIRPPIEKDAMQISSEWIDIDSLQSTRILPGLIENNILGMINNTAPAFLGLEYIFFNHA